MSDYTILTAVRNRTSQLELALPSWMRSDCSQILIVDYSSSKPVEESLSGLSISDSRIKIVRVSGKNRWWLSDAFNIGLSLVETALVLKLDADHEIDATGVREQLPGIGEFVTGSHLHSRMNQQYTNGAISCHSDDLKKIGGWDARISTYGWDDSDLYERLEFLGLRHLLFRESTIHHLDHSDEQRADPKSISRLPSSFLRASIQVNKSLTHGSLPWGGGSLAARRWNSSAPEGDRLLESRPILALDLLSKNFQAANSIRSRLGNFLNPTLMRTLRKTLSIVRDILVHKTVPSVIKGPSRVVIRPEHGLGNRLRALASGYQLASRIGSELVVVWIPDEHCEAHFSDLFDWSGNVINCEEDLESLVRETRHREFDWRVKKRRFDEFRARLTRGPIYVRSSKTFLGNLVDGSGVGRRFLQALVPSVKVVRQIEKLSPGFRVGLHVRQIHGEEFQHLPFESSANWGPDEQELIDLHRRKTETSLFQSLLEYFDEVNASSVEQPVLVCTDNLRARSDLARYLGGRARFLSPDPLSRSQESVVQAMAEMYGLSACSLLIGSHYSAFSEVASLLSSNDQLVKLVGRDF